MNLDRVRQLVSGSGDDGLSTIGRYEIVREVAQGGTAFIYEAIDEALDRTVAIKVLKMADKDRLRREAQAAARLRHPNIVAIHEVGDNFIVMDFLPGQPLGDVLPRMNLAQKLSLLQIVARAVHYAHTQNVVHRDLKPANILVGKDYKPVITDFGLAVIAGAEHLTMTGTLMGTPGYMAPEQVRGKTQDPRVDTWALGVLLYQMTVGRLPFSGDSIFAIHQAITSAKPTLPAGPLGAVIMKALEKDPARRYQTADDLADDLGRFAQGNPVQAPRLRPWLQRHRVLLIVAAMAAGTAGVVAGRIGQPRDTGRPNMNVQAVFSARLQTLRSREEAESQALAVDPDSIAHLLARSESRWDRANLGRVLGRNPLPDFASALDDIDHVLRLAPGNRDARQRRGRTLAQRGAYKRQYGIDPLDDIAAAEHELSLVIAQGEAKSWRANARFHRALWRIHLGLDASADLAAAEGDLTPADSATKLMRRGRLRGIQKRFDEAETDFVTSLKDFPSDAWTWMFRAKARLDAGDAPNAESYLSRAIDLDPLNAESWNLRGHAQFRQGRFGPAAADYQQALDLDPSLGPETESQLRAARERTQKNR